MSSKKLSKEEISVVLKEIQQLHVEYLEKRWVNDQKAMCEPDLPDLKALLALEEWLVQYIVEKDECISRIQSRNQKYSLEMALQNLDVALADKKLLRVVFEKAEVKAITDEYDYLKLINQGNLALLSLASVRDIVSGVVNIRGSCDNCTCEILTKVMKLKHSIERIRAVIPTNIWECEVYSSYIPLVDSDINPAEYLMRHRKSLTKNIAEIDRIDEIFEVFRTKMINYYRKPYTGIPFTEMPVKHGFWWIATHLFQYENCEQFTQVQILRQILERYSKSYYYIDHSTLEKCGLLPSVDSEDSFIMANKIKSLLSYTMLRTFNFKEMVFDLEVGGAQTTDSQNCYEISLWNQFCYLVDEKLSFDPNYYRQFLVNFIKDWLQGNLDQMIDDQNKWQVNFLLENCATCEILYFQKVIVELLRIRTMNFVEGRIIPFQYEQQIYSEALLELAEKDSPALKHCEDSAENELKLYVESVNNFVATQFMEEIKVNGSVFTISDYDIGVKEDDLPIKRLTSVLTEADLMVNIHDFLKSTENRLY